MRSTLRECLPNETRVLTSLRKHVAFGWRSWAIATGFAFLAVGILVSYVSRHYKLEVPAQWTLLAAMMTAWSLLTIPLFVRLRNQFGGTALIQDIKEGRVRIESYDIERVIKMEEYEDLGPAYFIQERDGGVYFFMGQYLDELVESRSFPATQLEVVRAPLSGTVLGVKCSGDMLEPVKKIRPFSQELVRQGGLPTDGSAIPVGWGEIERTYT